jgi:hypothetical protein
MSGLKIAAVAGGVAVAMGIAGVVAWNLGAEERARRQALALVSEESRRVLAIDSASTDDLARALATDVCACDSWACLRAIEDAHRTLRGKRYRLFDQQDPRWRQRIGDCAAALSRKAR